MSVAAFPAAELDSPAVVLRRLSDIEHDLALRQNLYEAAAGAWYAAQREIKRVHAQALLGSLKTSVTEKKAEGDIAAYDVEGAASEAEYKALNAVIQVLETRASILQSVLKAQGRMGP